MSPGRAVIHDMRRDASLEVIKAAVKDMGQGWFNSLLTRWILRWLRRRAYSLDDYQPATVAGPSGMVEKNGSVPGSLAV